MDPKLLEHLISFRKNMHRNPEIGFKQFETQKAIIGQLLKAGVTEDSIRTCAKTGLVVDIKGKGKQVQLKRTVAFRADIDALSMNQNSQLSYRSKNIGAAHMCGHDGHTTCLIGFAYRYMNELNQIPQNRIIRLLFQPSEQGPISGAKAMVEDGCLEGVDEVYGFHNWPNAEAGQLFVRPGPVMARSTPVDITIQGTVGHGSEPHKIIDCVQGGIKFHQRFKQQLDKIRQEEKQIVSPEYYFVASLPVFQAGVRRNVFSRTCKIQGGIRSFDSEHFKVLPKIKQTIDNIFEQLSEEKFECCNHGFPVQFYPSVVNTKLEAQHVERVAKLVYGQENVKYGDLPVKASQDFSFFTEVNNLDKNGRPTGRPGAFFFLTSGKGPNSPMLHSDTFDFNDGIIEKATQMWLKLAIDRLTNK